ncbi:type II secretion system protein [Deinococcus sp. UYEF24]
MKNVKRTQGFTLIELLIVIAIIGILAAVLIPNLLGAQKRAYDTGAQACAKSIQTAEATYQIDKQAYVTLSKVTAAGPVVVATPDTNNTATTGITSDSLGVSTGCTVSNVIIGGAATAASGTTQATYAITVQDTRGSKTYTVTPSTLTGS